MHFKVPTRFFNAPFDVAMSSQYCYNKRYIQFTITLDYKIKVVSLLDFLH